MTARGLSAENDHLFNDAPIEAFCLQF